MKRFLFTAAAAASLFWGGTCFAQFVQDAIQVTVPFDFYVGKAAMPSGTYRITPCMQAAVKVQHCTQGIAAMQLTFPSGTEQRNETGKLVFNKYGEKYFLSEVKGLPASGNLKLPVGPLEKSVQAEQATVRTYEQVTLPKPPQTQ